MDQNEKKEKILSKLFSFIMSNARQLQHKKNKRRRKHIVGALGFIIIPTTMTIIDYYLLSHNDKSKGKPWLMSGNYDVVEFSLYNK